MPRNLREEIERIDRQKSDQARKIEIEQQRHTENLRNQKRQLELEDNRLIERAKGHFDAYLYPVFQEVAGAKHVALSSPYEYRSSGLFGGLKKARRPVKGGLIIGSSIHEYDDVTREHRRFGMTNGRLIWNVKPENDFDSYEHSYDFLYLGVTSEGRGSILNDIGYSKESFLLSNSHELDGFVESIFKVMSNGSWCHYELINDNSPT